MDYLIFDTEAEASVIEQSIFQFGAGLAQAAGYATGVEGIHGRKSGVSNASTAVTSSWSPPRQRLDGKWIVLHPKHHPAAQDPDALAQLEAALPPLTVETLADDWFSQEDDEP